jgi:hypothetical protein
VTPEEVRFLVDEIKEFGIEEGDDEAAHNKEDDLYKRIVQELASINEEEFTFFDLADLIECAQIAMETRKMKFFRWFA